MIEETPIESSGERSTLEDVMEDGHLVPEIYELGLRRAADTLSSLLREASEPGVAPTPQVYGDAVSRKLARLLQGVAELRGQGVEIARIVGLLDRVADGRATPADVHTELQSIFDRIHQPYTIVGSDGVKRGAAEGDPRIADLPRRSLAIDDVREVVWKDGREIPLRRRMLLRRFLLLFAQSPGATFSKEDVVRAVWGVEYHPLRNDPALFTSVMRVRKMLGDASGDILRSGEGGYRLVVPEDFCCVTRSKATPANSHT